MKHDERAEVLKQISVMQSDCASVTVEIGGTADNGQVEHGSLYIKNAPAKIVSELSKMGYSLHMTDDGLRVE